MANHNRVSLIGRLTADPKLSKTAIGIAVANFSLAINRVYTQDGEKKETTLFVDITAWGRTAEIVGQYTSRGATIFVEGRLDQDTWEDKETGKSRSKLFVTAETVQLFGNKDAAPEDDSEAQEPEAGSAKGRKPKKND